MKTCDVCEDWTHEVCFTKQEFDDVIAVTREQLLQRLAEIKCHEGGPHTKGYNFAIREVVKDIEK